MNPVCTRTLNARLNRNLWEASGFAVVSKPRQDNEGQPCENRTRVPWTVLRLDKYFFI
jgi:hypothetical protein